MTTNTPVKALACLTLAFASASINMIATHDTQLQAQAALQAENEPVKRARLLYADRLKVEKESIEQQNEALKAYREATHAYNDAKRSGNEDSIAKAEIALNDARSYYERSVSEGKARIDAAKDTFLEAFAKANWDEFDTTSDSDLLYEGLIRYAAAAKAERRFSDAIKAYDTYLAKLPKHEGREYVITYSYTDVLLRTDDTAKAATRLSQLSKEVGEKFRPGIQLNVGDLQAMSGKTSDAAATYASALKSIPAKIDDADPRRIAKSALEARVALVGKAAPALEPGTWLGREATTLAALKGRVVVLHFWATWSEHATVDVPALAELATANKGKAIDIIGVTQHYTEGCNAVSLAALTRGENGARVSGLDTVEQFTAHLRDWHNRVAPGYPFAVAANADFTSFKASSLPTTIVVNAQGEIALFVNGKDRVYAAERCIANLMK